MVGCYGRINIECGVLFAAKGRSSLSGYKPLTDSGKASDKYEYQIPERLLHNLQERPLHLLGWVWEPIRI